MNKKESPSEHQEHEDVCLFCETEFRDRAFLDNDLFYVIFDANPVSPGHSLVISKRHIVGLSELDQEEWQELHGTIRAGIAETETIDLRKIYQDFIESSASDTSIRFCQEALSHPRINTKPDGYNHGINDGSAAGRTVSHLHWHIIPRFEGDVTDPRGGVRFVIPDKGNYKIPR